MCSAHFEINFVGPDKKLADICEIHNSYDMKQSQLQWSTGVENIAYVSMFIE